MDIDLNLLKYFFQVAETGNFSSAARKLDLPLSSVSRGIAKLEEELDMQLFTRTTRRVTLTAEAGELYNRLAPLLLSVQREIDSVPAHSEEPAGDLRITAPVEFGQSFLADAVARFLIRFPAVRVDVLLTNQVIDLVADKVDLALRIAGAVMQDSSLVAKRLSPFRGNLYASRTYVARKGTPKQGDDLCKFDWVEFTGFNRSVLKRLNPGKTKLDTKGRVSSNDLLYCRDLMVAGAGIGILPTFLADPLVTAGKLVAVMPKQQLPSGYLWLVRPGTRHVPPKVSAFRDFIIGYLGERPLGFVSTT